MLPPELLKVILASLSRDDLDALSLANVTFRDVVLRHFSKEPLRCFAVLEMHGQQRYELLNNEREVCHRGTHVDIGQRMRFVRVGQLRFVRRLIFNEKIFDILLPLKDAWRDVYDFTTPSHFTSPTLVERAFSELFCCRRMDVVTGVKGPLSAVEVIEWLNVDVDSDEPRRLVMGAHQLGGSVENLVQQMKADFLGSKEARRYVITIHVGWAYNGEPGRFLNKHSSEKLTISHFGDYGRIHSVAVERKPADDEY